MVLVRVYGAWMALYRLLTRWPSLWSVLAVVLGAGCYWNSLDGGLVHDDVFAVKDNMDLRADTPLSHLFLHDFWGESMSSAVSHKSYRPLTVLSFRLNYLLHGLRPWGYHLGNLVLHCLATWLFGCLCRREVFAAAGGDRENGEGPRRRAYCSGIAMLLFSIHPVHTEAVSGVVGRADVLASIFFLLSLLLYCSSTRTQTWPLMLAKFLLCVTCACAAMLCKEHGATVLGVCLVYDVLVANRNTLSRWYKCEASPPSLLPLLLRATALLLATAVLLAVRVSLLHGQLPRFSAEDNPASFADSFTTRSLSYGYLAFFNLRLLFYPYTLSYDWQMGSIPLILSPADPRNLLTAVTLISFAALTCVALAAPIGSHAPCRGSHAPLWGLLLLVVPFLPASNLLIRVGFVVAERILYIPSFGWCVLVAAGVYRLYQHWPSLRSPLTALLLVLLVLFAGRTVTRNTVWDCRETLFRSALPTVPSNAKVHFNYANFLKDSGRDEEAILFYRRAIELAPSHAISHNNLGSLLQLGGKEAEFHFRQAVRHNPAHFRAFYNLGRNLEEQEQWIEAENAYRESLSIRPAYLDSLMSLASLLSRGEVGRAEEGWGLMERALEQAPDHADLHNNAGTLLARMGREQEAVSMYERALRLAPDHATAMSGLARLYRNRGQNDEVERLLRRSLSLHPDPSTHFSLASMLHNTGRLVEAEQVFRQGVGLDPSRTDLACGLVSAGDPGPQVWRQLMQTLLQTGRLEDAQATLDHALRTHPSSSCVQQVAGTLLLQQDKPKQAIVALKQALQLSDSTQLSAEVLHLMGGAYKDLGQLDRGEKAYRDALALAPDRAVTRGNLAALLHLKKDYMRAHVEYQAALKIDPENSLIKTNLQKLERLRASSKRT